MRWSTIVAALVGLTPLTAALDPIEVSGNKFFYKDGSQFFIKGVAYQLVPTDPLLDAAQCKRDASLMKELGTNTIRVYHVDGSKSHDDCMKAFADVGIYVLIDLDTFDTYIIPENNYWNKSAYQSYAKVMDAFQKYDNTLGFFIGNENIAKKEDSPIAPYLKAAARDMKAYRDASGYRKIPVGYSAADILQLRPMLQDYLTCGGNSSEIVDFFALNSYSWCDPSTYEESSYNQLEQYAVDFPVPIFLSETGCNVPGPRLFNDQDAIFGKNMVNDWSGAIIYEWIQEENNYGIITYGPPAGGDAGGNSNVQGGFTRSGTPIPRSPDFDNLKKKWANNQPTGVKKADYDGKVSTRACPSSTAGGWWEVDGDVKLPTVGELIAVVTTAPTTVVLTQSLQTASGSGSGSAAVTTTASPSASSSGKNDSSNSSKGNSAATDKQITVIGSVLASAILGFAILL